MANRKRKQDRTVNQAHMPRTNGPCKKSSTGLHVPTVTNRHFYQVIDEQNSWSIGRSRGQMYVEYVRCTDCGKTAAGYANNNMITNERLIEVMRSGASPTCWNGLDKLNEKHKS